jgi:hypothetical protein
MKESLKVFAIGDIVGRAGRDYLKGRMQGIVDQHRIDLVIANGENAAGGKSITPNVAKELFDMGVRVITTGNHVWDSKEIMTMLDAEPALLRPANYPNRAVGHGYCVVSVRGYNVCVINLQGRTFMPAIDCPFMVFDGIYNEVKDRVSAIIVDLHAEATSEKRAFGWYVDGRASAVFGTHTHVQTADEEILTAGTGYITDIGMTGPFDSVIGMEKRSSIERFLSQTRVKFDVASENVKLNGIIIEINADGKTSALTRVFV